MEVFPWRLKTLQLESVNPLRRERPCTWWGAHDALSALLIERAGFDAVYVGSYSTQATYLGKLDLDLMSKTERLMLVRNIVKVVNIPVVADIEEGIWKCHRGNGYRPRFRSRRSGWRFRIDDEKSFPPSVRSCRGSLVTS